jgi:hypothetical protein
MKQVNIKNKEELVDAITNYYNEAENNLEKLYNQWVQSYSLIRYLPKKNKKSILWRHVSDLDIVWSDMREYSEKYNDLTAEYVEQEVDNALKLIDPVNWKVKKKLLMEISTANLEKVLSIALEHINNALSTLLKVGARMDCTYINTNERDAALWTFCDIMRLHRVKKGIERYLTPKKTEPEEIF